MAVAKCRVAGSDYVGVFATCTDRYLFTGMGVQAHVRKLIADTLGIECVELSIFDSNIIGLFARANSNGIVFSNMISDAELSAFKSERLDIRVCVPETGINAAGNNIIANDKIALVNPDYSHETVKQISDALGVEVIRATIGGFKTLGANNILTNKGFLINNRSTDEEKEAVDKLVGFESMRTTANTGYVNIGLSAIANSNGAVVGDSTTGFELARIMEALEIE